MSSHFEAHQNKETMSLLAFVFCVTPVPESYGDNIPQKILFPTRCSFPYLYNKNVRLMIFRIAFKLGLCFLTSVLCVGHSHAQSVNFDWVKASSGPHGEFVQSMAVDVLGNVYTTGYFQDTVDFDPSSNNLFLSSNGAEDIFIQKLSNNGDFVWAKSIGGNLSDAATSLVIDSLGNIIISGVYRDTVDFNPNGGVTDLVALGNADSFILKLDSNGNLIWVKSIVATNGIQISEIELSKQEDIYATGYFSGICDADPSTLTNNLFAFGTSSDIFAAKYDFSGNLIWANSFGTPASDIAVALAIDTSENITFIGESDGHAFIKKIDSTGVQLWHEELNGFYLNFTDIDTDSSNNIVTCGYFSGNVDVNPDIPVYMINTFSIDGFVLSFDSYGEFNWAISKGAGATDKYNALVIGGNNKIYLTGSYQNSVDFNSGPASNQLASVNNSSDIFIQNLDSTGVFIWAKSFGGTNSDEGRDICLDQSGNVYLTGIFQGLSDFDPSNSNYMLSGLNATMFVEKLGICYPNSGTDSIVACDSLAWIDGLIYTTNTSTPLHTLLSSGIGGCDSIVNLDLTLKYSSQWTDTLIACEPYVWIDGNTYNISTNTPTYILTNAMGCDSTISLDLTYNGTIVYAFVSNAVTVKAFPSGGQYQWLDCNNSFTPIPGATDVTYVANQNGSYAALVTINGCTDTTNCLTIAEVNLIENSFEPSIQISPNPTSGIINIKFGNVQSNISIIVMSSIGLELDCKVYKHSEELSVEISGESGTYFLRIENQKGLVKFVKVQKL